MLTVTDIEPYIESEFGSRLVPLGFKRIGKRRWIRSQKQPIRELFTIGALKGGCYSPIWGLSTGIVPSLRGHKFQRQSTDKNAVMDLIIDPIDITANVPTQTFGFITGYDSEIPVKQIRVCAEHFVPIALAEFSRIHTLRDFCCFFLERSGLKYRRFAFDMYIQHQLVKGFVHILRGRKDDGVEMIQKFCNTMGANFSDLILSECIREAEKASLKWE
jgi:hypothetical protein